MLKDVVGKVPWKKVVEISGYAVVGLLAVAKSVGENKEKQEYEQLKKEVADLKGMKSKDN